VLVTGRHLQRLRLYRELLGQLVGLFEAASEFVKPTAVVRLDLEARFNVTYLYLPPYPVRPQRNRGACLGRTPLLRLHAPKGLPRLSHALATLL
jgi:hypothetical protein